MKLSVRINKSQFKVFLAFMVIIFIVFMYLSLRESTELQQTYSSNGTGSVRTSPEYRKVLISEHEGKELEYVTVPVEEFTYYQIPEDYQRAGGELPEDIQRIIYDKCKEYHLSYYVVLAMIERESGYKANATGDNGKSKGYLQVMEKWHKNRMEELGVTDLYDPEGNITVALDYLMEILEEYEDIHISLMYYNMGNKAGNLVEKGVYFSQYSIAIMNRAYEIEQELTGL